MVKTRIAVLVSGGGTNLQALIDAQKDQKLHSGEIVLVISNSKDAYALERAKLASINTFVVEHKDPQFEQKMMNALKDAQIDLIILAGFLRILSKEFIQYYHNRIINVHPSLIPSFCGKGFYGLKVHEAALEKGVKVTGATVHFVNEIPDGGQIIAQKAVRIYPNDTPEKLQKRVMKQAEWKLLPQAAELISKQISEEKEKSI